MIKTCDHDIIESVAKFREINASRGNSRAGGSRGGTAQAEGSRGGTSQAERSRGGEGSSSQEGSRGSNRTTLTPLSTRHTPAPPTGVRPVSLPKEVNKKRV